MIRTIVFYISGHGFGHAARDIEVINALRTLDPDIRVIVRTTATRWLFDFTLNTPVEFHRVECDTGVAQIDSLHLDEAESIRRAAAFHKDLEAKAAQEAAFLRAAGAGLVVGDVPALAFRAGALAGVPVIALSNFTWDWIYEGYPELLPGVPDLVPTIRNAYSTASLALRLPMWGGFKGFPSVRDIPLIARRSHRRPPETRQALGLPGDRLLVLFSFGGCGLDNFDLRAVAAEGGRQFAVVTTGHGGMVPDQAPNGPVVYDLHEQQLYANGFRYEDLVAAVDVVLTKPGYSIIAECAAHRTAILYTSRGRFAEYDVLVASMPRFVRSQFIPQEDLYACRWTRYLDQLLALPQPAEPPRTDGAEVAANLMLDWLTA